MNKIKRIRRLVELLNYYRNEYYNNSRSEISDFEYDQLFDELSKLESETGFIMAISPTQTVGYEVVSELDKVKHNHPMLSLDKTKSVDDVIKFLDNKNGVIMAKMDGLTCSLRYVDGHLISAETRGNGEIGEDILHCAKTIKNIPIEINCLDEVIIDGEVIITYDDFEKINSTLPEHQRYKHPRNLASGSIRQLDSSIAAQRNMKFIAWKLIKGINNNSFFDRWLFMDSLGFDVVPLFLLPSHYIETETIENDISAMKDISKNSHYPIDGCVFGYDDVAYSESLGATGHHLRSQLAFKFYDETYETRMIDIEWTMGRTGVLTPVAVFEPIDIDGSTVERASLHNLSIMEETIGIPYYGQQVEVFKANMIIPQIASANKTDGSNETIIHLPEICPICGAKVKIENNNSTKNLICINPYCDGKQLAKFTHFVSKKGMDIKNLSEATLETLLSYGFIHNFKDIYHLSNHYNALICLDGFGKKSIDNLLKSIEDSRNVKLENFICALGIEGIGSSASKTIASYFKDLDEILDAYNEAFDWTTLNDFGQATANNINNFFNGNITMVYSLSKEMNFILPEEYSISENPFTGKSICVTGKLNHFTRDSINEKIISLGAKAVGSVSKKTDYLITNESSGSSKYKKAIELNIPIITEKDFLNMIGD